MASYPTSIANLNNPTGSTSMADPAYLHATQHSSANDEIEAIETELGTNPSGTHATVKDRIAAAETAASANMPAGVILPYAGSTAPTGFLLAYGQTVSRTTYATLFAVLGTFYNTGGEAPTDFRLPDLRGRVPVGLDSMGGTDAGRVGTANTLGTAGGAETLTLLEANLPSHSHVMTHGHASTFAVTSISANTGDDSPDHAHTLPDHSHSAYTYGGNGGHSHAALATTRSIYAAGGSSAGLYALDYNTPTTTNGAHEHNVGVNGSGALGVTGASARHQHSMSHGHSMSGSVTDFTGSTGTTGSGTAINKMPPYLTISYIIKF